jgi:glutamate-1-semialdehyde 2,1-aminomutase
MVGAAAADATLEIMETTPVLAQIAAYGEKLKRGLSDIMTEAGIEHAMVGPAAMPGFIVGTSKQPKNFRDVTNSDLDLYAKIAKGMFERGVEYEEDPREPFFLCAAHNDTDLGNTLERFNDAVGAARR